ncbi:MAG: pyridoxamine 5'-phosphate oxidase [Phycisphaeraceae bacterium]|nr:pyridoxamine 5'-phosphate oxidase [Phycisphaeraceae bacterium]MBX3406606.1 pyridoxamine 5'-phosphate oxidase [Phycisphaeraceae bacterium]
MITLADPLAELRSRIGLPTPLPATPMPLLAAWFEDAQRTKDQPNTNAMILATATASAVPSARVVLCKAIETDSASLVFYTNYTSRKACEIEANPRVACVFHWDSAGRQARLEGRAERVSEAESDAYFRSRPLLSRLGAWASEQGRPLDRRADLVDRVRAVMKRFGVGLHHFAVSRGCPEVPRPPHWGGYRVHAAAVELWLGGGGRLNDRAVWKREAGTGGPAWNVTRIQP